MTTAVVPTGYHVRPSYAVSGRGGSHLKLTRRGRAFFTTVTVVPLAIAALVFALNGGGASASADLSTGTFQYVTVEAGQSLWQVAEAIAPTADPRDVVADIVLLNQLGGSVVHPGERLAIPAIYTQ